MNKKAALELSVNAIIIFVLAFAMLGVGLTVTNMLSKKVEEGVGIIGEKEADDVVKGLFGSKFFIDLGFTPFGCC